LYGRVAGADIGALSSSAYSKALERKLSQLRDQAGGEEKTESNITIFGNEIQGPGTNATDRTSPVSPIKLSAYINSLSNSDLVVSVRMSDFLFAVTNIKPSVTRSELDHYEALGEEFNDLVP
jgi:SpoVK/Ycf46/Vps4 family AAA+-type ATPase